MWPQVAVIIWAQWRTVRNHLPRAGFSSLLGRALSFLWYALVLSAGIALAVMLPFVSLRDLEKWLPSALLGLFVAWQVIPLFTLSTGWSLQLNKIQIYPVRTEALFGIEVLLRITASPELILILLGATVGLVRHPALPAYAPLVILLLLPINLLLSLAIRELVLHSFERNRFREIFSIILISIGILPQVLLRRMANDDSHPYLQAIARAPFTPWASASRLALGHFRVIDGCAILFWTTACYLLARWFFIRSLRFEETPQAGSLAMLPRQDRGIGVLASLADKFLGDPMAALLEKEIRSLVRMPRFRVAFGMACMFSLLIFFPLAVDTARSGSQFLNQHFLPLVTIYGLLILSDSLLLNIFGTDRAAVSVYFVSPVNFRAVIQAKNLAAVLFLTAQCAFVMLAATALRRSVTTVEVATALSAVAVVGLFLLSVGNLTSILLAKPSDPRQTFRRAAGGKMQLWIFLCTLGMGVLLGAAYLAQWALNSSVALFAVLAVEFTVGLIFYKVAIDSAVERGTRDRERVIDALSKGAALIGSGN